MRSNGGQRLRAHSPVTYTTRSHSCTTLSQCASHFMNKYVQPQPLTGTCFGSFCLILLIKMAAPEATLTNFKKELTCSICNELFKEPKTLFCLHTFCEKCLSKHITKRAVDADPQAKDSREKVPCPLCQYVQELPEADVKHVKTNHGYKNMVSHLLIEERVRTTSSSESDRPAPKCQECEEGHDAVAFCKKCNEYLCEVCNSAHKRLKRSKTHEVATLEEISSSSKEGGQIVTHNPWKCSKHDDLDPDSPLIDVTLYCRACDELICNRCGIMEPHGNHEKYEASRIINEPEYKPKIHQHEEEVRQVQEKFTAFIKEMENLKKSLEENREKANTDIIEKAQALNVELEEKEALLQKVEEIFERKKERLVEQLQELHDIEKEMVESRKFVNDTLTFGTPEEILFLKTQMITRMEQLRDKYNPYPRTPKENDIITFDNSA